MSIKITLTPLKQVPDSLTLYWSDTPFTPDSLPANSVSLAANSTEYVDTTIPVNSLRYYMVKASKAGLNDMFSQCMLQGHYPNTGPGKNQILRGDWKIGLMDILTPAQMFTVAGLKTAVGQATNWGGAVTEANLTAWWKFIYKGKILFIPNTAFSNSTSLRWSEIYNAGLMYGVDGPGAAPVDLVTANLVPAITATVNQKKVVSKDGSDFLVRQPRMSTLPTDQIIPANDKTSFQNGEWWDLICRMGIPTMTIPADTPYVSSEKWGDGRTAAAWSCVATPHFMNAIPYVCAVTNLNWSNFILRNARGTASAEWVAWLPVLELIPS